VPITRELTPDIINQKLTFQLTSTNLITRQCTRSCRFALTFFLAGPLWGWSGSPACIRVVAGPARIRGHGQVGIAWQDGCPARVLGGRCLQRRRDGQTGRAADTRACSSRSQRPASVHMISQVSGQVPCCCCRRHEKADELARGQIGCEIASVRPCAGQPIALVLQTRTHTHATGQPFILQLSALSTRYDFVMIKDSLYQVQVV
jgi:hypothetical protein